MKEFTQDDIERISGIVTADNSEAARAELADLHPADIAELFQQLDTEQSEYLFKLLDEDTAADVLMELDEDERLKLIEEHGRPRKPPSRLTTSTPTTPLT